MLVGCKLECSSNGLQIVAEVVEQSMMKLKVKNPPRLIQQDMENVALVPFLPFAVFPEEGTEIPMSQVTFCLGTHPKLVAEYVDAFSVISIAAPQTQQLLLEHGK